MEREPFDEGRQRRASLDAREQRRLGRGRGGVEGREHVVDLEAATDPRARAVADDLIDGLGPIAAVDPLIKTLVMRARTPPQ